MYVIGRLRKIRISSDPQSQLLIFIAALLLVLQLYAFSPLMVFFGNAEEVALSPYTLIKLSLPFIAITYIIVLLVSYLLPAKYNRIYIPLISAISLLVSMQSNILVAYYGVFDGTTINFSSHHLRSVLEIFIWITIIMVIILYYAKLKIFLIKITFVLIIFQTLYFAWQTINSSIKIPVPLSQARNNVDTKQLFDSNFYKLSSEKNIIHILLDAFQSNIFKEIITENPDYQAQLQGFTFFENNIGIYPTTVMSVPVIMSAKTYKNNITMKEFLKNVLDENIQQRLSNAGYIVDVKTMTKACFEPYANCYSAEKPDAKIDYYQLIDYGIFRSVPHFVKRLIYNKQKWLIANNFSKKEIQFQSSREALYYKDFVDNVYVGSAPPTYKFFHVLLPHNPITLNQKCTFIGLQKGSHKKHKRQADCTLNMTLRFIEKLKTMGVYDKTMIIISSDHGGNWPLSNKKDVLIKKVIPSSLALLLVKPFEDQSNLKISDKLTSLLDISNTILSSIHLESLPQGTPVFSPNPIEEENISHKYYYYTWEAAAWKREFLPPISEYTVRGTPLNTSSWHMHD